MEHLNELKIESARSLLFQELENIAIGSIIRIYLVYFSDFAMNVTLFSLIYIMSSFTYNKFFCLSSEFTI